MTTSTIIPTGPLTADDVAAMKLASTVSFHTGTLDGNILSRLGMSDVPRNWDGSIIRLHLREHGDPVIFSARQQRLFPLADGGLGERTRDLLVDGRVWGYGDSGPGWGWQPGSSREFVPACFHMLYTDQVWATIARMLRVGTMLALNWVADNNTDVSREAGLHLDSLRLEAATGKYTDAWKIASGAYRDNTARMIRRSGSR